MDVPLSTPPINSRTPNQRWNQNSPSLSFLFQRTKFSCLPQPPKPYFRTNKTKKVYPGYYCYCIFSYKRIKMIFKVYMGIFRSVEHRLLNAEAQIWSRELYEVFTMNNANGEILFRSSSVFHIHHHFDNAPSAVSFRNWECGNRNIKTKRAHQTKTDHYKVWNVLL